MVRDEPVDYLPRGCRRAFFAAVLAALAGVLGFCVYTLRSIEPGQLTGQIPGTFTPAPKTTLSSRGGRRPPLTTDMAPVTASMDAANRALAAAGIDCTFDRDGVLTSCDLPALNGDTLRLFEATTMSCSVMGTGWLIGFIGVSPDPSRTASRVAILREIADANPTLRPDLNCT